VHRRKPLHPPAGRSAVGQLVCCAALLVGVSAVLSGAACTTNHDALARRDQKGGTGGGGAGGVAGSLGNSGGVASGGRPNPDDEVPGDDVLTIVNGVIDARSIELCFARLDEDGVEREFVGAPLAELPYVRSAVLTSIEGLSFADDLIEPWVLAGDLQELRGLNCEAAVRAALDEEARVTPPSGPMNGEGGAGEGGANGSGDGESAGVGEAGAGGIPLEQPKYRARAVAALPPGTLNIGRSVLLVLTGCMGGAAYGGKSATQACGAAYTRRSPTLAPVIVKLSRKVGFDKVGLQGVHAAPALAGSVDIAAAGGDGSAALLFASGVTYGAIAPRPADVRFSGEELGVTARDRELQVIADGGVVYQQAWPDIREASGLTEIRPTRSYTAILLGPDPRLSASGFWNKSAFALVDNDPTRDSQ